MPQYLAHRLASSYGYLPEWTVKGQGARLHSWCPLASAVRFGVMLMLEQFPLTKPPL